MKIAPPFLKSNHTIGICCPSGFLEKHKLNNAINLFEKNNWNVILGKTTNSLSLNYFSGSDDERLEDFQNMLDDESINCIVFGRGGYGLSRIIDKINWEKFKKNPKWICGFSDITILHCHINTNLNIQTIHSPMAKNLNIKETEIQFINYFINILKGSKQSISLDYNSKIKNNLESEIVGGNLTLISHSIGSNSEINTENKILFLEDVGEYIYNIDRMFLQLKRAKKLDKINALLLGGFTESKDTKRPFNKDVNSLIKEHCSEYNFPLIFNFPIGHQSKNYSIKIGAIYKLEFNNNIVKLYEN